MTRRQPVAELPKSRTPLGSRKPPTPTPWRHHSPTPRRSTLAPKAAMALLVLRTSSPSRRPEIRVSPTASAPKIRARFEIDLSPGTRTRPLSAPARRAVSGAGVACDTGNNPTDGSSLAWEAGTVMRPATRVEIGPLGDPDRPFPWLSHY